MFTSESDFPLHQLLLRTTKDEYLGAEVSLVTAFQIITAIFHWGSPSVWAYPDGIMDEEGHPCFTPDFVVKPPWWQQSYQGGWHLMMFPTFSITCADRRNTTTSVVLYTWSSPPVVLVMFWWSCHKQCWHEGMNRVVREEGREAVVAQVTFLALCCFFQKCTNQVLLL